MAKLKHFQGAESAFAQQNQALTQALDAVMQALGSEDGTVVGFAGHSRDLGDQLLQYNEVADVADASRLVARMYDVCKALDLTAKSTEQRLNQIGYEHVMNQGRAAQVLTEESKEPQANQTGWQPIAEL